MNCCFGSIYPRPRLGTPVDRQARGCVGPSHTRPQLPGPVRLVSGALTGAGLRQHHASHLPRLLGVFSVSKQPSAGAVKTKCEAVALYIPQYSVLHARAHGKQVLVPRQVVRNSPSQQTDTPQTSIAHTALTSTTQGETNLAGTSTRAYSCR